MSSSLALRPVPLDWIFGSGWWTDDVHLSHRAQRWDLLTCFGFFLLWRWGTGPSIGTQSSRLFLLFLSCLASFEHINHDLFYMREWIRWLPRYCECNTTIWYSRSRIWVYPLTRSRYVELVRRSPRLPRVQLYKKSCSPHVYELELILASRIMSAFFDALRLSSFGEKKQLTLNSIQFAWIGYE